MHTGHKLILWPTEARRVPRSRALIYPLHCGNPPWTRRARDGLYHEVRCERHDAVHHVRQRVAFVPDASVKRNAKPVIDARGGDVHGKRLFGDDGANVHFGQCPVARDTQRPVVVDEANEDHGAAIAGQLRTKIKSQFLAENVKGASLS